MDTTVVFLGVLASVLYGLGALMAAAFLGEYTQPAPWWTALAWPIVIVRALLKRDPRQ